MMREISLRKVSLRPDTTKEKIQAHFIEYQAMVSRISRFISLQFVVWPVLVAFITLTATGFRYGVLTRFQFMWLSVIMAQVVVATYYYALYEVYNHIRYIELVLQPKVASLLGTNAFWNYEKYLHKVGKSFTALIGDIAFPQCISGTAVLLPVWEGYVNPVSWFDMTLLILDVAAFSWLCFKGLNIVKVREDFTRSMKS